MDKTYIAIDLKSFYASVECRQRGLDPLTTNLVVADASRTDKTICLAVTPSLKSYGIGGRARLFEVVQKVREINNQRLKRNKKNCFIGSSYDDIELKNNPDLKLDYIVAVPRMTYYMDYSTRIFNIYKKYIGVEDMHVYSIDEVFLDVTSYLGIYNMTAQQLAMMIIKEVLDTTGITATAGIGSNLYLCKIAMDIVAKHMQADENGVRIATLDEYSYRELLWEHQPLTDFWRVGKGISKKLQENGMYTMGDVAMCSLKNEDKLYKLFGVNAELLIDHSWGYEPCEIKDIKKYKSKSNSLFSSQVLSKPYTNEKAKIVVGEMAEAFALDLVGKKLVADHLTMNVNYDIENMQNEYNLRYVNEVVIDGYGRQVPKPAHGSSSLDFSTASTKILRKAFCDLFDKIVNKNLLIRKIGISAVILPEKEARKKQYKQIDLFSTVDEETEEKNKIELEKEKKVQKTILEIKKRFGKNAVMNVSDLQEDATTIKRNSEIGGHKA